MSEPEFSVDETCPYCGMEIEDLEEYFSDQTDPKFSCPHCGEPIQGFEEVVYLLEKGKLEA